MAVPGSDNSVSHWLELFFDLVVVAAVAVIADGVAEDPTWGGLGLAALTYVVIWQSWLSVVLYANVAEDRVRIPTVVVAMFAIALMAAAAPGHFESRANAFVIGFLIARSAAAGAAQRTGRVLTSYPLLQAGGLSAPWIASLWVAAPGKYALWALGIALDLRLLLLASVHEDRVLQRVQARSERASARGDDHGRASRRAEIEAVEIDTPHLDERLGLFVIIVLGEVVVQIVGGASRTPWGGHLMLTVAAIATELDDNKELIVVMLVIVLWAVGWSIFGRRNYGSLRTVGTEPAEA